MYACILYLSKWVCPGVQKRLPPDRMLAWHPLGSADALPYLISDFALYLLAPFLLKRPSAHCAVCDLGQGAH